MRNDGTPLRSARRRCTALCLGAVWVAAIHLATGCTSEVGSRLPTMKWPSALGGGGSPSHPRSGGPGGVPIVRFGDWYQDSLRCAQGECEHVYAVVVPKPGRVHIDVQTPRGGSSTDFELVLLDRSGQPIAHPESPSGHPLQLEAELEAGEYLLKIRARGSDDRRLKYRLVASLKDDGTTTTVAAAPGQQTRASGNHGASRPPGSTVKNAGAQGVPISQTSAQQRGPGERVVVATADVLGVETEAGSSFVLLDTAPGVVEGMRGEVLENGETIGEFVIDEVYADGSRGRVIGELAAEVGFDAVAEILR